MIIFTFLTSRHQFLKQRLHSYKIEFMFKQQGHQKTFNKLKRFDHPKFVPKDLHVSLKGSCKYPLKSFSQRSWSLYTIKGFSWTDPYTSVSSTVCSKGKGVRHSINGKKTNCLIPFLV